VLRGTRSTLFENKPQGNRAAMIAPNALGHLPETPSQTAGPYVHIGLIPRMVARGITIGLATRLDFDNEVEATAEDPVLRFIEQPARRKTLVARREKRDGANAYVRDIHLQGENEAVFFDARFRVADTPTHIRPTCRREERRSPPERRRSRSQGGRGP
jgi:protocatechuate 3,4-dioxygenase beta subunit